MRDARGVTIFDGDCMLGTAHGASVEDERRIVACVNACRGISTKDLDRCSVESDSARFGLLSSMAQIYWQATFPATQETVP